MMGLDTNILVRYITQDDPQQCAKVNALFDKQISQENSAVISKIVLSELTWVLSHAYGYSREQIALVIQQIIITQEFVIEDSESAIKALQDYQTGKAGFADYFLARTHLAMGAKHTVSFDKKALQNNLFQPVE